MEFRRVVFTLILYHHLDYQIVVVHWRYSFAGALEWVGLRLRKQSLYLPMRLPTISNCFRLVTACLSTIVLDVQSIVCSVAEGCL